MGGYAEYRPRCAWRHRLAHRAGRPVLRKCLAAVLILECSFGAARFFSRQLKELPFIRVEKDGGVEWFVPGDGGQEGLHEVFGIQFRLEDGEIRIYRSRQEIKSH